MIAAATPASIGTAARNGSNCTIWPPSVAPIVEAALLQQDDPRDRQADRGQPPARGGVVTCAAPVDRREPVAAAGGGRGPGRARGARGPRRPRSTSESSGDNELPPPGHERNGEPVAGERARCRPGRPLPTARRRGAGRPRLRVRGRARGSRAGAQRAGPRSSRSRPPASASGPIAATERTASDAARSACVPLEQRRAGRCAARRAPGRPSRPWASSELGRLVRRSSGSRVSSCSGVEPRGVDEVAPLEARTAGRTRRRRRAPHGATSAVANAMGVSAVPPLVDPLSRSSPYQTSARGSSIAKMPVDLEPSPQRLHRGVPGRAGRWRRLSRRACRRPPTPIAAAVASETTISTRGGAGGRLARVRPELRTRPSESLPGRHRSAAVHQRIPSSMPSCWRSARNVGISGGSSIAKRAVVASSDRRSTSDADRLGAAARGTARLEPVDDGEPVVARRDDEVAWTADVPLRPAGASSACRRPASATRLNRRGAAANSELVTPTSSRISRTSDPAPTRRRRSRKAAAQTERTASPRPSAGRCPARPPHHAAGARRASRPSATALTTSRTRMAGPRHLDHDRRERRRRLLGDGDERQDDPADEQPEPRAGDAG